MKTFAEIQTELRTILPEGIDLALQALKNYLPPAKDKFNDLLLLEGRYQEVNKKMLQGVLSFDDAQLTLNQLRKDLLDFINSLVEQDLSTSHQDGTPDIYNGEVLYRIPKKMQVQEEVKCIVRVAFDKKVLLQDMEEEEGDVIKDLRISDVMGVELLDPGSGKAFEVRTYSETVQFVEKDLPTEWLFYVKPLLEGVHPLVLKISVVEIKNGIERKRNLVLEEKVEITATPPEKTVADDEFQQSGYALNFASPQATGKGTPGGGGTPSPSTAPKNMSKMRRLSSAMAALVVLLAATWAIRSAMQDPVVKQWDQTVANNTKEDYENFVDSYPASEQAAIARHRLDSIETAAWESALASNDTTRIHDYLNQYPEGRYFTDAMLALEKRRKPQVKEIIFCWQMLDTLLKITHEGGFAPYRFTFMQNGKAIRELPRDSIGFFTIPLKDLLPGAYEVWLQDAEGRAISDSLTVAPAKPPISETGKKKKTPTGISKKKPPTKKTGTGTQPPAISTPPPKPEEPKVEEPAKPATDPNNDKPVPMRSAARLPVYPGCEKSNKNKEEKCTERRIRDFLNDRVNYPDAAMRKRIQGTVNVFFTIERDGSVTEVQAGNDIGGGCAEEASRVVSQLPKFKPGQNSKGEPIRIRYTLPVTFRLN